MHKRKQAILDYIMSQAPRNPTYEELKRELGLRTNSNIKWHIAKLVKEGYLKITPRKLEVLKRDEICLIP